MSFDISSDEKIFGQVKVLILVERWISNHVRMEFAPMLKQYHMMVLLTFVIDALKGYTYTRRLVLGLIYRETMAQIFSQFGV